MPAVPDALRRRPLVLELDLTEGVLEQPPPDPLGRLQARRRVVLPDLLDALRRAEGDARVKALVVRVGTRLGMATAQELRGAVQRLRRAGKHTFAWAESYGEAAHGTVGYYLAAAFDEVWLQPSGTLGLVGFALDATFLGEALRKAGVHPQTSQRHEYKNAADMFSRSEMSEPHREALGRLARSWFDQVVDGVARDRRVDPSVVRAAVDAAPLLSDEALGRGLVDRLGYRDEVYDAARAVAGDDATLLFATRYRPRPAAELARRVTGRGQPVIALVHGVGAIRQGRSGRGGLGVSMGSDTVGAALRAAVADDTVRAVVFRVDSPGGSYVASDAIWREVVLARRAGKPVVVSMGDVAGSGGYFVAMAADAIVAQPGTLTGSIGVVTGKPVVRDLLDRLGVGVDGVAEGAHARMYSTRREFSDEEWAHLERHLDRIYDDFTAKVAEGRGLPREQVDEVARGRIWTGADAAERGLVDTLGGLDTAVALARQKAGIDPGEGRLVPFPHVSPLARVRPARSSEDPTAALAAVRLQAWGPLAGVAARLGLPAAGPLTMTVS